MPHSGRHKMTTIAYKDGILATDSRITKDGYISSDETVKLWDLREKELFYLHDRLLAIALAGSVSHFDWFLIYIQQSDFPTAEYKNHEVAGLIVGEKAVYEIEKEQPYLVHYPLNARLAVGSGDHYAISAMNLGKTAIQAVKHAMKFDTCTGGPVQSINLRLPSKKEKQE